MGKAFAIGLRFVVGASLVAAFGYAAFLLLAAFYPVPATGTFPHEAAFGGLACAAVIGYGGALALSRRPWRRVLWAIRLTLLALAVLVFAFWRISTWREWLICAGLAVAGLIAHHVAHRHALGWIIDSGGERQKVLHLIRGGSVMTSTTRDRRLIEEAYQKSSRRKILALSLLVGLPLACAAYHFYKPHDWALTALIGVFAGPCLLFGALPALIAEIFYQLGYQDMVGHKVLDPPVKRPGIDEIAQQMAHGDAQLAGEAEAFGLLNRGR